jgi:hypothetical protein
VNYIKHYNQLIDRSKIRNLDVYTESHHIIPKCLGGRDEPSNLVELTPEEHFVAHQLLVKIYPDNRKLLFAVRMMTISPIGKRTKNKMYGWLKRRMAELGHSSETREKIGKSHLGSKRSEETKIKMSLLQKERGGYGPKKHSEETKIKMSASRKGIPKPRSIEHQLNLTISLKGKPATPGFSGRKHSEESKKKSADAHLSKNLQPWETHAIINNIKYVELWKQLDIVYEYWIKFNNCGHRRICNAMNIPLSSSVENMIRWIRKNGNPSNNEKWKIFKETSKCKTP